MATIYIAFLKQILIWLLNFKLVIWHIDKLKLRPKDSEKILLNFLNYIAALKTFREPSSAVKGNFR